MIDRKVIFHKIMPITFKWEKDRNWISQYATSPNVMGPGKGRWRLLTPREDRRPLCISW